MLIESAGDVIPVMAKLVEGKVRIPWRFSTGLIEENGMFLCFLFDKVIHRNYFLPHLSVTLTIRQVARPMCSFKQSCLYADFVSWKVLLLNYA